MAEVRRQDQVPLQNQDNNPVESTSLEQSPAHEPLLHTRTSLEDAVAQRALKGMDKVTGDLGIPDRIPRGLVENPDAGGAREVVPGDKKKSPWVKRGVATLAGALAISVGAGIVHYKNTKDAIEDSPLNIGGGDKVATAPVVPGETDPSKMSADTFNMLTRVQQMDYAGPKLNANLDSQASALNDELNRLGWKDYNFFNRSVVKPSVTNTPQEIWDQQTLGAFTAWKTAQGGDMAEAKKLATGIAEGGEYDDLVSLFANGGGAVIETGAASDALPVITSGEYSGVKANGAGLIEFTKTNMMDGDQVRVIMRFTSGNNPDSARWVLVKTTRL